MTGVPSVAGILSISGLPLVTCLLWLTAQSQLTSRFAVGVTAGRVHAAQLDKPCGRKNKISYI